MKAFKYFLMVAAVLFATSVGFTACGGDEVEDDIEDITGGGSTSTSTGIKDNGNSLVFTYTVKQSGVTVKTVITAKFDGSSDSAKCTSCTVTTTVAGQSATEKMDDFVGMTKREVKAMFEEMKQRL